MLRQFLIAKIHRAVVTAADLNYIGSITIDQLLMEAVGIREWERVQVVDVDNGARLETYVIAGEEGQGEIQINGAAAHLVKKGDRVIIMAYALLSGEEVDNHRPVIAIVDDHNRILELRKG